jgi:hypothetical protein
MERQIIASQGMPKCRNAKLRNGKISMRLIIQSNSAGELEYDQRATVSSHS